MLFLISWLLFYYLDTTSVGDTTDNSTEGGVGHAIPPGQGVGSISDSADSVEKKESIFTTGNWKIKHCCSDKNTPISTDKYF